MWGVLSGVASIAGLAFAPGFFPAWYALLVAAGYGLLLPIVAVLHARHQAVRESGAILGTAAGTAAVAAGIAASANAELTVPAVFVCGIWWWTIGKTWAETGVLPRPLGIATMALAALALATAVASAPLDVDTSRIAVVERLALGAWTLALSFALWRAR